MDQAALFEHIESWWGDRLDRALITRILAAPENQLAAFGESLLGIELVPPVLPAGRLRPAVGTGLWPETQVARAARLLLLSDQVLFDWPDLVQAFTGGQDYRSARFRPVVWQFHQALQVGLVHAMHLRPLIDDGSVHLTPFSVARAGVEGAQVERLVRAHPLVRSLGIFTATDWEDLQNRAHVEDLIACTVLAQRQSGNLLMRSELDEALFQDLFDRDQSDGRLLRLDALANLDVPRLELTATQLIRLRNSADHFAEWRQRLSEALDVVVTLPDTGDNGAEAVAVVREYLSDSFAKLERANSRSPLLSSAASGTAGFAVMGISATTTGLITGSPWAAAASGAAGKAAETAINYVKTIKQRRKDKALLDIAVKFTDPT